MLITHFMEEAAKAERVIIMDKGKVMLDGPPKDIFSRVEEIRSMDLDVPFAVDLADRLRSRGIPVPADMITDEEMVDFLCQYKSRI